MKKFLAVLLALVMVFTSTIAVFAQDTLNVPLPSGSIYYYEDTYFAQKASVYNASLSTMSFYLACAGTALDFTENQSATVKACLEGFEFTNFETNLDFKTGTDYNTFGVAMAYKNVKIGGVDTTIIAVVPRSMNYDLEWGGNFILGTSGEAEGFALAAKKIEDFATIYTIEHKAEFKENVKVWMVGYSRGAAATNLAAGHMSVAGEFGTLQLDKENIYAYTFEAPKAGNVSVISEKVSKTLTNIHNIVSENDLITKFIPEAWGFIRYGVDEEIIPETRTAENEALFKKAVSFANNNLLTKDKNGNTIFKTEAFVGRRLNVTISTIQQLGHFEKVGDDYKWRGVTWDEGVDILTVADDVTMGEAFEDIASATVVGVLTRSNYVKNVQTVASLFASENLSTKYSNAKYAAAFWDFWEGCLDDIDVLFYASLTLNRTVLTETLQKIIDEVVDKNDLDAPEYANLAEELTKAIPRLVNVIFADVTLFGAQGILSIAYNEDLINPHYPSQVEAFLKAYDKNYEEKAIDGKVTDVKVAVSKSKVEKKIIGINTKVTRYTVNITPVAKEKAQKVEWRTTLVSKWNTGTSYYQDAVVGIVYIRVTDANGLITNWEYFNGKVKQTD